LPDEWPSGPESHRSRRCGRLMAGPPLTLVDCGLAARADQVAEVLSGRSTLSVVAKQAAQQWSYGATVSWL